MSEKVRTPKVNILGIQFDNVTRDETVARMEHMISTHKPHMICTPNADHVLQARHDHEFREILECADLVVSDGMAVVYASRLLGTPFEENVGGRLLLPEFASRAACMGYRLFLLGGKDHKVAQIAAARLCVKNPGLIITGTYTPPFMPEFDKVETDRMLDAVHRAQPDALFVCLGTPKQEKWIARNLQRLNVPVSIGVGAALDMISGHVYEPPHWVSNVGLEWLVKLVQEPKRLWQRYLLGIPLFVWLVLQQLRRSQDVP